jgi:very-short-patch-repair endonuclease
VSQHRVRTSRGLFSIERQVFDPQLGLATRAQLRRHGVTQAQIHVALAQGRWLRGTPGVYALPNWPPDPNRRLLAACLVTNGVASHASAAWLWGLLKCEPEPLVVSVHHGQSPSNRVRPRSPGAATDIFNPLPIAVHRSRDLSETLISHRRGVPATNPLRSLVDMAGQAPPSLLDEALDVALATGLVTVEGLEAEANRLKRPGRIGPPQLLMCLDRRGFVGAPSPSVLESRTLRLLNGGGIGVVRCETAVNGGQYRLDIQLEHDVFVEVDGYSYHWSPEQKRHDDARHNDLRLLGFKVLVYGWQDIVHHPRRVLAEIRKAQALTMG